MAGNEVAVPGRHQVRLDEVGAELDGEGVTLQRVRRQVAVRAAVTDNERLAEIAIVAGARVRWTKSQDCSGEREPAHKKPRFHLIAPWWLTAPPTLPARSDARMTDSTTGLREAFGLRNRPVRRDRHHASAVTAAAQGLARRSAHPQATGRCRRGGC